MPWLLPPPVNKPSSHVKGGWLCPRFSLDRYGEEKFLASTMVWSPDWPAHSKSLYQLCYPGTRQTYQQEESLCLRDRCALSDIKQLKNALSPMQCENVSKNHKLQLVVIWKAKKKTQSFKGIKAKCIPVNYYNQKWTWITMEILENWFYKHSIPYSHVFLKVI